MAAFDPATLDRWRALAIVDRDGTTVGTISEFYLDRETGHPTWALVETGLFGATQTFVPLVHATELADGLQVPYEKRHIKNSPRVDLHDELTPDEEASLFAHYGVDYQPLAAEGKPEGPGTAEGPGPVPVDTGTATVVEPVPDEPGTTEEPETTDDPESVPEEPGTTEEPETAEAFERAEGRGTAESPSAAEGREMAQGSQTSEGRETAGDPETFPQDVNSLGDPSTLEGPELTLGEPRSGQDPETTPGEPLTGDDPETARGEPLPGEDAEITPEETSPSAPMAATEGPGTVSEEAGIADSPGRLSAEAGQADQDATLIAADGFGPPDHPEGPADPNLSRTAPVEPGLPGSTAASPGPVPTTVDKNGGNPHTEESSRDQDDPRWAPAPAGSFDAPDRAVGASDRWREAKLAAERERIARAAAAQPEERSPLERARRRLERLVGGGQDHSDDDISPADREEAERARRARLGFEEDDPRFR